MGLGPAQRRARPPGGHLRRGRLLAAGAAGHGLVPDVGAARGVPGAARRGHGAQGGDGAGVRGGERAGGGEGRDGDVVADLDGVW